MSITPPLLSIQPPPGGVQKPPMSIRFEMACCRCWKWLPRTCPKCRRIPSSKSTQDVTVNIFQDTNSTWKVLLYIISVLHHVSKTHIRNIGGTHENTHCYCTTSLAFRKKWPNTSWVSLHSHNQYTMKWKACQLNRCPSKTRGWLQILLQRAFFDPRNRTLEGRLKNCKSASNVCGRH